MVAPLFPPLSAISRRKYGGGKPPPINSWPTAGAPAALSPFLPEAPSPLPFPLEDPPQSLTARRAAKPLASAVTGAYEPHFASWAFAAKKIGIACWGMTLASMRRRRAGRHRRCGNCYLGFGHLGFGRLGFGHLGFGHLGFGRLARLGRQGRRRPAGARRTGIDTAGFGPAVFAALSVSGDVFGGYVYSAIAGPPHGTRDCNTGLGDGWGEMVFRSL